MNPINDFSSNIKKIYLELYDYVYFHGPSEVSEPDSRFIGRTGIINKLKSVLVNNETKSGTYLVTGYRGMGKSSFVNKVIEEVSTCIKPSNLGEFFFRMIVYIFLLTFFKTETIEIFAMVIGIICLILLLKSFLYKTDVYRKLNKHSVETGIYKFKYFLKYICQFIIGIPRYLLDLDHHKNGNEKLKRLLKEIFWLSIIYLLAAQFSIYVELFKDRLFEVAFILLCLLVLTADVYANYRKLIGNPWKILLKILTYIRSKFIVFTNYFSFVNHIHLKINLGYDDLKEIDILRMISRKMETAYIEFIRTSKRNWGWKLVKVLLIYLLVLIFYYNDSIYQETQKLKYQFHIVYFFPSQDSTKITAAKPIEGPLYSSPNLSSQKSYDSSSFAHVYFLPLTKYTDFILSKIYMELVQKIKTVFELVQRINSFLRTYLIKNSGIYKNLQFIPLNIDYLLLLNYALFSLLINLLFRTKIFRMNNHNYIFKRIHALNEKIETEVTLEKSQNAGNEKIYFGIFSKKTKKHNIADVREIEKSLIEILQETNLIPRHLIRPEFIIVFDELDKIEPHLNMAISDQEAQEIGPEHADPYFSVEGLRNRQTRILRILSNLKHFLTTARAKFIFIAGRDLFDASLADVSDRNSFLGSIFNEIIYVESFLKDSSIHTSDITSMTETYICSFLLPPNYNGDHATLENYNKYLEETYFRDYPDNPDKYELDKINKLKRAKIIFTVSNFITYITYRSNGAPKKITEYFEEFISSYSPLKDYSPEKLEERVLIAGKSSQNLYLCFDYFNQFTLGMTTFLINPIFLYVNRSIKDFSDKLLVSSSFLIDHLYKYHNAGFSYRNLEMMPEIVDFNKAPQLRELITRIISFLTYTHIQLIDTGIYSFKFYRKISDDISLLSKINEKESAAFNFTLDESLSIKRHYKRELKHLESIYTPYFTSNKNPEFIRSISFIHMIIGDLHFYDEEYDNAIIEYMEAIQLFVDHKFEKLSIELITALIRNNLKLGITFEKKKTFESAFLTYGKLVTRILKFGERTVNDVGEGIFNNNPENLNKPSLKTENTLFLPFRESLLDTLRIFSQPFLANLQIIEKISPEGITHQDLSLLEKEMDFIYKSGRERELETEYIRAEIIEKMGDILFFKNTFLFDEQYMDEEGKKGSPKYPKSEEFKTRNMEIKYYPCTRLKQKLPCEINKDFITLTKERDRKIPCTACEHYFITLEKLSRVFFNIHFWEEKDNDTTLEVLNKLLDCFNKPKIKFDFVFPLMANTLSDIGDSFLSCANDASNPLSSDFILDLLSVISNDDKFGSENPNRIKIIEKNNKLQEALWYYFASSLFYKKSGDNRESSMQLTKILYVLRSYLSVHQEAKEKQGIFNNIYEIEKFLCSRIVRRLFRVYENTANIELQKYKNIFGDKDTFPEAILLNHFSLSWEIREVMILTDVIKLKKDKTDYKAVFKKRFDNPINPYSNINNIYNRILELNYQALLNYLLYKETDNNIELWQEKFGKKYSNNDANAFLIVDSITCYHEIIRSCFLYGVNYIINHSFLANTHNKYAYWCIEYNKYQIILKGTDINVEKQLASIIEKDIIQTISPEYHYEMALKHYYFALETHKEGKAYKKMIENLVFLNDDFNDNFLHFCAANERYLINSGHLDKEIKKIKETILKNRGNQKGQQTDGTNYFDKINDYNFEENQIPLKWD